MSSPFQPYATAAIGSALALGIWYTRRSSSGPIPDASTLGCSRETKIKGTAVVCGGSMSGIITTRVCAEHFEEVVLVDPEFTKALNGGDKTRIVQYKSSHIFLYPFIIGLRRLWPEIDERVREAGGVITDADFQQHFNGQRLLPPWRSDQASPRPCTFLVRRSTMEQIVEKLLVETCPNVRVIDGTARAIDLSDQAGRQIQSVTVRDLAGDNIVLEDPALVVDCTGASRAGVKWLRSAGCDIPDSVVSKYDPHLRYMTIQFIPTREVLESLPIPGGWEDSPFIYSYASSPDQLENTGFLFNRYENNIMTLMFACWSDVPLPRRPDEIEGAIRMKFVPDWVVETVRILVESTEPTMEAVTMPPCAWPHFEQMHDLPANFIAIGDAALKVNPVYGQGMAKAMLSNAVLNELLLGISSKEQLEQGFSRKYFKAIAPCNREIWDATKINDYGYASTDPSDGESLSQGKIARWFAEKLVFASAKDEETAYRLGCVRHLLSPASSIASVGVLYGVIKQVMLGS